LIFPPVGAIAISAGDYTFNPIAMEEGVRCWHDQPYTYGLIPSAMVGGTLFQGPHFILEGTVISFTSLAASLPIYLYVFTGGSRDGGLADSLPAAGWSATGDGPNWYQENPSYTMRLWSIMLEPGQTIALPATATAQTVMGMGFIILGAFLSVCLSVYRDLSVCLLVLASLVCMPASPGPPPLLTCLQTSFCVNILLSILSDRAHQALTDLTYLQVFVLKLEAHQA
jgi:hypothetical protein